MPPPATPPLPRGARLTLQRRAVVKALEEVSGRFTVAELHERARRRYPGLGLATTYRTLELLRRAGAVRSLLDEDGRSYIRCHPGHHHHLVCVGCGSVEETDLCGAPPADEVRRRHGFRPTAHELAIYGLCQSCG